MRCSSTVAMLKRRTSPHSGAKTGLGRAQLLSHAFHASCSLSSSNPGSSAQRTGTQRLLACVITGGNTPLSSGRRVLAGASAWVGAEGGMVACGATEQAAKTNPLAIMAAV